MGPSCTGAHRTKAAPRRAGGLQFPACPTQPSLAFPEGRGDPLTHSEAGRCGLVFRPRPTARFESRRRFLAPAGWRRDGRPFVAGDLEALPQGPPPRYVQELALLGGLRLHPGTGETEGPPALPWAPGARAAPRRGLSRALPRRWRRPASSTAPRRTSPTWPSVSCASRSWKAGSPTTTPCEYPRPAGLGAWVPGCVRGFGFGLSSGKAFEFRRPLVKETRFSGLVLGPDQLLASGCTSVAGAGAVLSAWPW